METTELTFSKVGGRYQATFTSTGTTTVQVVQQKGGFLGIKAALGGLEPVVVSSFGNDSPANKIFDVSFQEGTEVTLESVTPVTSCKILQAS